MNAGREGDDGIWALKGWGSGQWRMKVKRIPYDEDCPRESRVEMMYAINLCVHIFARIICGCG